MTGVIVLGVLNRTLFKEVKVLPKSEIVEVQLKTDYQIGFEEGFNAFINQFGGENLSYPPIESIAKYATETNDSVATYQYTSSSYSNENEKSQGYVDGYHRAANSLNCPR